MVTPPLELTIGLQPRARFDAIDVRGRVTKLYGDLLDRYPRAIYCSFHTTAGYLDQALAARLKHHGLRGYVGAFRALFPEGAGYRHDDLHERAELTTEQRQVEPRNADSHLAFMAAGLRTCVSYLNRPDEPVTFVDLDGVCEGRPRRRHTSVVGYHGEVAVERTRLQVPVSAHPIDSINLKHPHLGLYERFDELIARHGVTKGRLRIELAHGERQAGLTVNEYETLLMRHDLVEVLRNPVRFMVEKSRHALRDPRAIPAKTLGYAKYDLVRALNQLVEALGLSESRIERLLARAMAVPAERFLRMRRSISLLVSDRDGRSHGAIVEGPYQSPILVQWQQANGRVRHLDVTLDRFI
jgi:thiamine phosphate synthase YjbQ (UPF0047 family)